MASVRPDLTVLGFTLAVGVIVGTFVGLLPALAASFTRISGSLHEGGSRAAGWSSNGRRLRAALVVGEVALAVMLATGTGLLLRSFSTVMAVHPGFEPEGLLTMQIDLPARLSGSSARNAYYQELFARLRAIPGVHAVGGTTRLPLGSTSVSTLIDIEGRPQPPDRLPEVQFRRAVDDYFGAMRIPIRRGRAFTPEDGPSAPPVCVINQTMAARLFPGEDPVGRRVRMGTNASRNPWMTIVGVIGDVRHTGLEDAPAPETYVYHRQNPPVSPFIVVRTSTDPAALADIVRADLRQFDRALAFYDVRTMKEVRTEAVSQRRFLLVLVTMFGLLSLTLAAVGVYGVMALVVGERAREMGLRLALGAAPASLLRLVLSHAAQLSGLGIAIGLLLAWWLTPSLAGQLYGVGPSDPTTFVAVPALLLLVAITAALVPARRATRVDPMTALRSE